MQRYEIGVYGMKKNARFEKVVRKYGSCLEKYFLGTK
jgi:hypothetical protein